MAAAVTSTEITWTSVPRWPAPALPPAASYLACAFGPAGRRQITELLSRADPAVPVRTAGFTARWDDGTASELVGIIGECVTGVRIILAGPEATVMRASAVARELGAVAEELVLVATETAGTGEEYVAGPAPRRVFCAACRQSFDAIAATGAPVTCPGCAARLLVDRRFSRPRAAYFGWPCGPGDQQ